MEKAREIQVKADEEFAIEKVSAATRANKVGGDLLLILLFSPLELLIGMCLGKDRSSRSYLYWRGLREEDQASWSCSEDVSCDGLPSSLLSRSWRGFALVRCDFWQSTILILPHWNALLNHLSNLDITSNLRPLPLSYLPQPLLNQNPINPFRLTFNSKSNHSATSNQTNASRLKVLQTREQHLQELFEQSRSGLNDLTKDQAKYGKLLEVLVLQVSTRSLSEPKGWLMVMFERRTGSWRGRTAGWWRAWAAERRVKHLCCLDRESDRTWIYCNNDQEVLDGLRRRGRSTCDEGILSGPPSSSSTCEQRSKSSLNDQRVTTDSTLTISI